MSDDSEFSTIIGVDYGSDPPTTIASHRCARCNATLDAVESDMDTRSGAFAWQDAVEAHKERCVVVGDWVRADLGDGEFVDGPVATLRNRNGLAEIRPGRTSPHKRFYIDKGSFTFYPPDKNIRRIPRPGQSVQVDEQQPTISARLGHLKHGPGGSGLSGPCDADCKKCEMERSVLVGQYREPHALSVKVTGYTSKPITVTKQELDDARDNPLGLYERVAGLPPPERKFDGMTEEQCSVRWEINRHHVERGLPAPSAMTVKQIAAAKAAWVRDVGLGQSAQLRARIDAAREQELVRVQIDADPDDTPW